MARSPPKQRSRTESDAPSGEEQLAAYVADAVETCLSRSDVLSSVLSELEADHVRGRSVQDDLNDVFSQSGSLREIARLGQADRLGEVLDTAVENGALAESDREAFREWWATVDWIEPGVLAYDRGRDSVYTSWTDAELELNAVNDRLVIDHTLYYGVDELYSVRAPVTQMFNEGTRRVSALARSLPEAFEQGYIGREELAAIQGCREALEDTLETLSALTDADTDVEGGDERTALGERLGDGVADEHSNQADAMFQ